MPMPETTLDGMRVEVGSVQDIINLLRKSLQDKTFSFHNLCLLKAGPPLRKPKGGGGVGGTNEIFKLFSNIVQKYS